MSETICEACGKPQRVYLNMELSTLTKCVLANFWPGTDTRPICTCSPANTLDYVTEVAPFTCDDWNHAMKAMKSVKISCDVQLTEYNKRLLEQYAPQEMPDAIHAEYTDGDGAKYAGTLYRVLPKEREYE